MARGVRVAVGFIVTHRLIPQNPGWGTNDVRDALAACLVASLLDPPSVITVASPWISDVVLFDNRSGSFSGLDTDWPLDEIRLSKVLRSLMQRGTTARVACRDEPSCRGFIHGLRDGVLIDGTDRQLRLRVFDPEDDAPLEHAKTIVADSWVLTGSMNFTFRGLEMNGEAVSLSNDPRTVAEAHLAATPIFEGIR